jgi:hypothetical protein
MVFTVKINNVDYTQKAISAKWELKTTAIEALELEIFQPDPADVDTGKEVILYRNTTPVFEGIIYEKHLEYSEGYPENIRYARIRALSKLVLYENYIITRSYTTGTTAGEIISDIASVIEGVDTTNVEDGPELQQNWEIQNRKALDVLTDIAKATDYLLFMRPGLKLYYKQKTVGESVATFDTSNTIYVENNEDNWNFKNRILYYGKDNQLLADVSEGDGDRPLVISDPFLTDEAEANRRAITWLNRLKYAKREIRLVVEKQLAENLDLGSTVTINFPNLGINSQDVFVTGLEYSFDVKELYATIVCGGELEYFERILDELEGRDSSALFGQHDSIPEILSTLSNITTNISKLTIDVKTPIYLNKPPLKLVNAVNVVLNDNGYAVLISNATSGGFEIRFLPPSGGETFSNYILAEWFAEKNGGSVKAELLDADGNLLFVVYDAYETQFFSFPRWPWAKGFLTYRSAGGWSSSGASASNVRLGQINEWCIRLTPNTLGMNGEIYYPSTQNLGLDLNRFRYMRLYLYGDHAADFTAKIRLYQDASNYKEGTITVLHDVWAKYELVTNSFTTTGTPSTINYIGIISPYRLLIDSDFVFLSHVFEMVRLKFTLSRPDTASASPQIQAVKIVWREGG